MGSEDYNTLLHAILKQAMDDYIKLQHPKFRKKKYLQEAFDSAVDMFFDSEFSMLHLTNDMGEEMNLKDMITQLLDDDRANLDKMRKHIIEGARSFWETKLVNTLYIPKSFIYDGHVYIVQHTEELDPEIDFEKKIITLNRKEEDSENQERFVLVALQVMLYHEDIGISQKNIEKLGKALFRMLRINSCFTGD